MKAVKVMSGTIPVTVDTTCQVAIRDDGVTFMRVWSNDSYNSWTNWWRVENPPTGLSEDTNANVRLPDDDGLGRPRLSVRAY